MNRSLFALLASCLFLAGCSGGGSATSGVGTLSIEVTDAPIDYSLVEEATIWIQAVRVHADDGDDADEGGFETIYEGEPLEFNLMELRNGLRSPLAMDELPVGAYGQIRLVVSRAYLRLTNGAEYDTDLGTIHLTSQATSGFKVIVDPPIQVVDGIMSSFLLDVDLTQTFRPIPASDPLNAETFHLHPVIRVANLTSTGDIQGLIQQDDGTGALVGVGGATVYILPPGGVLDDAIATTASEDNGAYAVLGLEPGTYDIRAELGTLSGQVDGQLVSVGTASVVDVIVSE